MPHTSSTGQPLAGVGQGARTRAERLAAVLDERIRGLAPGEPVGTLESLRAETGLAYATVSEAVRLLRDRGVLEIRPGRGGGLFAADRGPVVRLRHTLLSVADEPGTVADAIELREHLEELIDLGAARHRTGRDVADLRRLLRELRAAPGWDGFMRANWALHERIAAISPNAMARAVYVGTLGHLGTTSARLADDRPADDRPADDRPADDRPADDRPADDRPGDDPPADDRRAAYRAVRYQVHADLVEAIADGDEAAVRAAVAAHRTPAAP
ncbi:FCD domain-containing protein [Nonomuraea sp. LP-02]|uniref:FadR/GntR family transcriptional regulator n=1 Tax=Nonomuraea sp. LP-02 TaxID=3097960 RepID=UPI002E32F56F|nr:FCD domain-containing protein [Nonomuraea sp. LP-02]MED7925097.1 FCD domain-containing protein [Nonomuraea sp. LP-02]